MNEPQPEQQHDQRADSDKQRADAGQPEQDRDLQRLCPAAGHLEGDTRDHHAGDEQKSTQQVKEERPLLTGGNHDGEVFRLVATERGRGMVSADPAALA